MLVNDGFIIVPWDWRDFAESYITNDTCKDAINEMTGDDKYDKRYDKTKEAVKIVNQMPSANYEICSKALEKKKKCVIPRKRKGEEK